VLVAEPDFGQMKRLDVSSNEQPGGFQKPQFVPQRLDLLAPLMEIGGPLTFPGTCHGLAPAPVSQADACGERAKLAMPGIPMLCFPPNPANALTDTAPCCLPTSGLHHRSLVRRQATMHTGKAGAVQDSRVLGPEHVQGFKHDIGVPHG
jgi:hypothetical protein